MGGGGGSWGRKDHPHGSLCNNDSNVNDGAATSINSGLLQERQRSPARGFTLQSVDLGHVGVSAPQNQGRADAQKTNNNRHTHSTHTLTDQVAPPSVNTSAAAPGGAFSADAAHRCRTCVSKYYLRHYSQRDTLLLTSLRTHFHHDATKICCSVVSGTC